MDLNDSIFGEKKIVVVDGHELIEHPPEQRGSDRSNSIMLPYVVGRSRERRNLFVSEKQLSQGVNIIGATGSGKSNLFCHFIPQISNSLTPQDVGVVFDSKGSFRRMFFRQGRDVVITFRRDALSHWNLIEEVKNEGGETDLLVLNDMSHLLFGDLTRQSKDVFFPMAAKAVFAGVLQHFAREDGNSNKVLQEFWLRANADDIRAVLAQDVRTKGLISYLPERAEGQTFGVIAQVKQIVDDVFQEGFAEAGEISIRREIRRRGGRLIFLDFPPSSASTVSPAFQVLVGLAIREALAMGEEGLQRHGCPAGHVWFIIDEFPRLPRVTQIETGINFGRELGLRFVMGMQSHEQVRVSYESEASSILAGLNTVFAFTLSDRDTREFVKGLGGRNRKRIAVENVGIGDPVQQLVEANVVEDADILSLPPGRAITFMRPGFVNPFKVQFALYDGAPTGTSETRKHDHQI